MATGAVDAANGLARAGVGARAGTGAAAVAGGAAAPNGLVANGFDMPQGWLQQPARDGRLGCGMIARVNSEGGRWGVARDLFMERWREKKKKINQLSA